jgi:hypothetical protein
MECATIYDIKFIISQPGSQSLKRGMFYVLANLPDEQASGFYRAGVQA